MMMERRISWRWFSLGALVTLVFAVLWDGVAGVVLYFAFAKTSGLRAPDVTALLALGAVGIFLAYYAAIHLINRTTVRMDATRVTIEHGPLPWFGAKNVCRADIGQVISEKYTHVDDEEMWLQPKVTYAVKLLLKNGKAMNLATKLRAPEQAIFIEQQIRKP